MVENLFEKVWGFWKLWTINKHNSLTCPCNRSELSSITMDDKKLCMTGINFLEKDKLHEQATDFFKANFLFWYTSGDNKFCGQARGVSCWCLSGLLWLYKSMRQWAVSGRSFWANPVPFGTNFKSRNWREGNVRGQGISERQLVLWWKTTLIQRLWKLQAFSRCLSWVMGEHEQSSKQGTFMRYNNHEYEGESYPMLKILRENIILIVSWSQYMTNWNWLLSLWRHRVVLFWTLLVVIQYVNTLNPRQNGHSIVGVIFKYISSEKMLYFSSNFTEPGFQLTIIQKRFK